MSKSFKKDYTGKRFGRLEVLGFVPTDDHTPMWRCICDCGNEVIVWSQSLRRGMTKSCGCLNKEILKESGHKENKENPGAYSSWRNMMCRSAWMCHPGARDYGEKGIYVDPDWHDFRNFVRDMGPRPEGHSIDRIDSTKGYSRDNCRWADTKLQNHNRRNLIRVVYRGSVVPAVELAEKLGISYGALNSRANRRGRDFVEAFRSMGVDVDYV